MCATKTGGYTTPGVYIEEKNLFPNPIVEVATAVPAFIGYTEKAVDGNKSLLNQPKRITSMEEFRAYFGGAPQPVFTITDDPSAPSGIRSGNRNYVVKRDDRHSLYYSMLLFYANGGGACYIVSAGDYNEVLDKEKLGAGIRTLLKESEPTMVVVPEAVNLPDADGCYTLQREMLLHCGYQTRSRFAILDIYEGYKDRIDPDGDCIERFREAIGDEFLDYGAAYYPWINTTIVQENELDFRNLKTGELLPILTEEVETSAQVDSRKAIALEYIGELDIDMNDREAETLHKTLTLLSPLYRELMKEMHYILNLLPVSAAMAGIYTMVDNTKGVWKAPANTSIAVTVSPTVAISHEEQEDLNLPRSGKAVNAIRAFLGEGIKIWGARTLDGNSLDWRYINVRRTMIMLEQSIKNAVKAYVFDPNVANTWVSIRSMISSFLTGVWKRGGLAGSSPEDAFSVHVGLGETMTPEDILEGIMRVTVLVAITRPAEFIEITFQQQMQKS